MRIPILVGTAALAAVFTSYALQPTPQAPSPAAPAAAPAKAALLAATAKPKGHLILQVEGNVQALNVIRITPKPSAFNLTKVKSDFQAVLFDIDNKELGSYPVDLSRFDRNPANIGKPIRVEGCEVIDSRIAAIINVPHPERLDHIQIRRGEAVISNLNNAQLSEMIRAGGQR